MLVIASCATRNSAVSSSGVRRASTPLNSQRTAMPRGSRCRSAYQRIAESRPRSSSTDGPEVEDQAVELLERAHGELLGLDEAVARRLGRPRGERGLDLHGQRAQRLARLVVQLAREALALVLLRGDHLAQQLLAPLLALLELAVEPLELARARLDALLQLLVRARDRARANPSARRASARAIGRGARPRRPPGRGIGCVEVAAGDPLGRRGEDGERPAHAARGAPGEDQGEGEQRGDRARGASAGAPAAWPNGSASSCRITTAHGAERSGASASDRLRVGVPCRFRTGRLPRGQLRGGDAPRVASRSGAGGGRCSRA